MTIFVICVFLCGTNITKIKLRAQYIHFESGKPELKYKMGCL